MNLMSAILRLLVSTWYGAQQVKGGMCVGWGADLQSSGSSG